MVDPPPSWSWRLRAMYDAVTRTLFKEDRGQSKGKEWKGVTSSLHRWNRMAMG